MNDGQIEMFVTTNDQIKAMSSDQIIKTYGNGKKSVAIRYLSTLNFSRSEIAKMLNIRYQHVRNVLTEPTKGK